MRDRVNFRISALVRFVTIVKKKLQIEGGEMQVSFFHKIEISSIDFNVSHNMQDFMLITLYQNTRVP